MGVKLRMDRNLLIATSGADLAPAASTTTTPPTAPDVPAIRPHSLAAEILQKAAPQSTGSVNFSITFN